MSDATRILEFPIFRCLERLWEKRVTMVDVDQRLGVLSGDVG